ncbi:hypothetical protein [Sphingomonas sp. ACRSK]|uniref:hypothetical protein n=1 Tax=Sphingomonas sp. ACRSK TaxID=2918213 RepID=UPI001EF69024|nr:hypothetical protein [Sphingomonas sp. ACRSK]MCG7349921.1 hypothetical protein [Sphingomonas sp. ACRSK]
MIVLNPPAPLRHWELITSTPEQRAVETAIRIARVPFRCAENVGPLEWLRLLEDYGADTTFILDLPVGVPISVRSSSADDEEAHQKIVDGAPGVLDLAATIAKLAAN